MRGLIDVVCAVSEVLREGVMGERVLAAPIWGQYKGIDVIPGAFALSIGLLSFRSCPAHHDRLACGFLALRAGRAHPPLLDLGMARVEIRLLRGTVRDKNAEARDGG